MWATQSCAGCLGSTHLALLRDNAMAEGRSESSMQGARHVPKLVGIAHDIDGDDAAILNLQGGGLENVAPLDGDEPRQAVDKTIAHEARPALGEDSREGREQPHDVVESGDRRPVSRRLY